MRRCLASPPSSQRSAWSSVIFEHLSGKRRTSAQEKSGWPASRALAYVTSSGVWKLFAPRVLLAMMRRCGERRPRSVLFGDYGDGLRPDDRYTRVVVADAT